MFGEHEYLLLNCQVGGVHESRSSRILRSSRELAFPVFLPEVRFLNHGEREIVPVAETDIDKRAPTSCNF